MIVFVIVHHGHGINPLFKKQVDSVGNSHYLHIGLFLFEKGKNEVVKTVVPYSQLFPFQIGDAFYVALFVGDNHQRRFLEHLCNVFNGGSLF
ncbi:hypothetical protein SDC9_129813 [bioreactor metagenome]|uniref:Uncharacterized protein n=1 Tax=bioreactor metagenome TaxID=1076179 RepID=A0A645D0X2_9ZZZZ